jgi:ribonuclease BN (tRNA processing enzyme)
MTDVTLTVCGSAGTHAGPGRCCSGYLLAAGDHRLALDLGNGSLTNLQQRCDVGDLDAVVLSHLHPDHFADIYSLYYALRFHPRGEQQIDVHAPAGASEQITRLLGDESRPSFDAVCRLHVAAAGDTLALGPCRVQLHPAAHPVECLASRITVDGRVIAYTGDSGPTSALLACARDADLLICDATWLERARPLPEGVHMTGREAGQLAAEAGVRRLLLSHLLPTNDPDEVVAEAAAVYDGEVLAAHDLLELSL